MMRTLADTDPALRARLKTYRHVKNVQQHCRESGMIRTYFSSLSGSGSYVLNHVKNKIF